MSYIGGKARGAAHILAVLNHPRFDDMPYLEPFVGMGHVLRRVVHKRTYTASDGNALVVRLLTAIQPSNPTRRCRPSRSSATRSCGPLRAW